MSGSIKVIVSMIGLDGHTTGGEVVSMILRDAGIEVAAVENVKRFVRPPSAGLDRYDWLAESAQSPYLIGEFVEIKTVWHPIGA